MKRLKLSICLLILAVNVHGQETTTKDIPLTNAEKFTAKSGSLIRREFIDIGSVGAKYPCKIQIAIFSDLISKTSIKAVRLEYNYPGDANTKIGLIDVDEVDGALKSIKILKDEIFSKKEENYTEVAFTSRSGFSIGAYYSNGIWEPYMEIHKNSYHSMVTINMDDFNKLYDMLLQAKAKL